MVNQEQLTILNRGVEAWNSWRAKHLESRVDLSGADLEELDLTEMDLRKADLSRSNLRGASLHGANLEGANLRRANLRDSRTREAKFYEANLAGSNLSYGDHGGTNFRGANLRFADLRRANLYEANLDQANLYRAKLCWASVGGASLGEANLESADLSNADLSNANLCRTNLSHANLRKTNFGGTYLLGADLSNADLSESRLNCANLVEATLRGANLSNCSVYGVSAWNVNLEGAIQSDLVITQFGESVIQVDNLEVAQFIYLLLNNNKIRGVIDTITSKLVLILGRFTRERKAVLDAIRQELRDRNYLPVLFDFEKPTSRYLTETVSTLAHMARFVIADITDAKSIPQELGRIVPFLPSVPVQPILLASQDEYGMFEHLRRFPWVLEPILYQNQVALLAQLGERVISRVE